MDVSIETVPDVEMAENREEKSDDPSEDQIDTFSKKGVEYKLNDYVYISTPEFKTEPKFPCMGRIDSLLRLPDGSNSVVIEWCYRPQDTAAGKKPHHGRTEVFPSTKKTKTKANYILRHCVVEPFNTYRDRKVAPEDNVFYWKRWYDPEAGEFYEHTDQKMGEDYFDAIPNVGKNFEVDSKEIEDESLGESESSEEEQKEKKRRSNRRSKKESMKEPPPTTQPKRGRGRPKKIRDDGDDAKEKDKIKKKAKKGRTSKSPKGKKKVDDKPITHQKYEFQEGMFVWVKMSGYPWWPGKVCTKEKTKLTKDVLKLEQPGTLLIFFYGSDDYNWMDPKTALLPFEQFFSDKCRSRDENLMDAIHEAVEDYPDQEQRKKYQDELSDDDVPCEICKGKTDADKMLLCDNCDFGYHMYCLDPPLRRVPETNWYCDDCKNSVFHTDISAVATPSAALRPGVMGLPNLGSTCYINSTIQCLNAAGKFRGSLLEQASTRNKLLNVLHELIDCIWKGKKGDAVDPKMLMELRKASGDALEYKYHSNQHQDMNEYVMHLLEYINLQMKQEETDVKPPPLLSQEPENELKDGVKTEAMDTTSDNTQPSQAMEELDLFEDSPIETKTPDNANVKKRTAQSTWEEHTIKGESAVISFFDGMLERTRTCPHGHRSQSHEIFRVLPLQFPQKRGNKAIKLKSLIRDFGEEEIIECRCLSCGGTEDKAFKQKTTIIKFPQYLIIQLGRFSSMGSGEEWWSNKINTEVDYPLHLKLGDIVSQKDPEGAEYDLFAIANHKGGISGGHYWAFVRSDDGAWFNFNDNVVRGMQADNVHSNFAYMLFYQRSPPQQKSP
eukprot:TRINITY_DN12634_c0_g1_i1.p1 TRINITY_DN12634_c0_g1~~TRINITY_DN12634_c0_g1_i1.p1  ORF type:complete len:835 (+),score=199.49 TRINITY_DN12634_c0_g1_i1:86-2590(+)